MSLSRFVIAAGIPLMSSVMVTLALPWTGRLCVMVRMLAPAWEMTESTWLRMPVSWERSIDITAFLPSEILIGSRMKSLYL